MAQASDWIAYHARRTPDRLALIDQGTGRRFTYGEFNARSAALAAYMRDEWGLAPGDRVAILGKNSTEYFEFQFACIKLGVVMLPLNWRLAEPELLFILNDAEPKGLLYDAEFAAQIPALLAGAGIPHALRIDLGQPPVDDMPAYDAALEGEREPAVLSPTADHDTTIAIMYTAGTTGHPKGALITHGMNFWNTVNISVPTGLNRDSVYYVVLPTFHTAGLNLYANPVLHWGGVVIVARAFEPGLALQTFSDPALGVTHFFGVPAMYLFMAQHADFETTDLSGVKSWGNGGAPIPVSLLETYAARGIIIQPGFGMTETSPTVFLSDRVRARQKPTSVGQAVPHTWVRVVDDDFNDVPFGEVGELVISGPNVTPGYLNRPEANASSFTTDIYGQRWLHSGDAARMDEEGCVYIVDRYKDMYLSGGENVYPAEVENVIFGLPEISEVAVIGVPDERWGESGLAVVALKAGQTLEAEAIIEHCRANLARYKVPREVAFVETLPRNAAGKVLKRDLRDRFGE